MKKILKVILIILLVILVSIGTVVGCTGMMVTKGVREIAKQAMDAGPQAVTETTEGVAITTELKENKGAILQGVEMCKLATAPILDYPHSTGCTNTECETIVTFDGAIPDEIAVTRYFQGNCVAQTIPNIAQYVRVIGYEASIKLDKAILDRLALSNEERTDVVKTPNSKFSGSGMLSMGSDVKFTLNYTTTPAPEQDEFRLGSKLITIRYSAASSAPQPQ